MTRSARPASSSARATTLNDGSRNAAVSRPRIHTEFPCGYLPFFSPTRTVTAPNWRSVSCNESSWCRINLDGALVAEFLDRVDQHFAIQRLLLYGDVGFLLSKIDHCVPYARYGFERVAHAHGSTSGSMHPLDVERQLHRVARRSTSDTIRGAHCRCAPQHTAHRDNRQEVPSSDLHFKSPHDSRNGTKRDAVPAPSVASGTVAFLEPRPELMTPASGIHSPILRR